MATLKLVNGSKKGMWADVTCSYGSGSFSMTKVIGYYTWGKSWDATKTYTHTLNVPNGSTTFQTIKGSGSSGTGIGVDKGGYVWDISPDTVTCSGSGSGYVSIVCSPSLGSNFAGHTFQSESTIDIGSAISVPSFNSISASEITSSSAKLSADVNAGGGTIHDGGFDLSTDGGNTWDYYSGLFSGYTSVTPTGLSRYTTYWYRAYMVNEAGGSTSDWSSFTTLAETPALSEVSVSDITSSGVTLSASVTDDGGRGIASNSIEISASNFGSVIKTVNSLSGSVSGLSRYTTYYARATANNSSYTGYSAVKAFTTLAETPTLSALSLTNITYNSVTASFSVIDDGGREIVDKYIDIFAEQACTTLIKSVSSNSGTISGLSPNTTYYARGNSSNASSRGYTTVQTFTTAKPVAPTISSITTPIVQDKSIKVQLNATAGDGASSLQYRFSKDNGSTYTSWQSANNYTFTGLQDDTSYTFKAQVKDNFENISTSSSKSATTAWIETVKVITSQGVKSARMYLITTSQGATKVHKRNIKTI